MSMKATIRQVDSVIVIDISGRITLGEGCAQLRELIRDQLSNIDSSGIGELVSAFTAVSNQGGQLKLLNLTKKVHDLLQITKLYTVFDIHDDEAKGIASFQKS